MLYSISSRKRGFILNILSFSSGHSANFEYLTAFNQENEAHLLNLLITQISTNIQE